jgi:hypothetical protein
MPSESAQHADDVALPLLFTLGTLVRSSGRIFRVTGIGGNDTYLHCSFQYLGTVEEWAAHIDGLVAESPH